MDIALAAHQLLVLIDGLSAERVLYPDRVTPARQQQMLDELLGSLRAASRVRLRGLWYSDFPRRTRGAGLITREADRGDAL